MSQGFGMVDKDQAYSHLAVRTNSESLNNFVADKAVIRQLQVQQVFAVDGDDSTGQLVFGPTASEANQVPSFVDDTGTVLQATPVLADAAGSVSAVNLFVGTDPTDSSTFLNGITSDGSFVPYASAVLADFAVTANANAGSLNGIRVGQLTNLAGSLTASGAVASASAVFTIPAALRPTVNMTIPAIHNDGGVATVALFTIVAATGVATFIGTALAAADTLAFNVTYQSA